MLPGKGNAGVGFRLQAPRASPAGKRCDRVPGRDSRAAHLLFCNLGENPTASLLPLYLYQPCSRSGCGSYRPSSPPLMQCAGMLTVWRRPCGGSRRAVGAQRHQHPGSRSSRRASLQLRSAVIEETSPVPDERVRRGLPGVGADGPAVRQVFNRIHCCWVDLPSDDLHRVVRVEGSIRESVTL